MIFPNKLFNYRESVVSKFSSVLIKLSKPKSPILLYREMKDNFASVVEFINVIDCLYALGVIDIDERGDLKRNVVGNKMR